MFKNLTLKNFMLFKNVDFQFGEKLNVIIGENGSGKTQLLKLLFALGKISVSAPRIRLTGPKIFIDYRNSEGAPKDKVNGPLKGVFNVDQTCDLIHLDSGSEKNTLSANIVTTMQNSDMQSTFQISIERGNGDLESYDSSGSTYLERVPNLGYSQDVFTDVLFFQAREMLSIYKGFRSLNDKYLLPYDLSVTETISKLGMPYLKESPKEYQGIIKKLESHIMGKIYLENEQFYFHPDGMPKNGKHDWAVDMAAEGWRKLGMLLQVLRNGELHKGMTLLWDEPEANLNPKLICQIANVIVQLSNLGIQIFLSTHSLFLLREIDMLLKSEKNMFLNGSVRYFNFIGKGKIEQGNTPEELGSILLLDESLEQSRRFLNMED